jgi:hypothetical protein
LPGSAHVAAAGCDRAAGSRVAVVCVVGLARAGLTGTRLTRTRLRTAGLTPAAGLATSAAIGCRARAGRARARSVPARATRTAAGVASGSSAARRSAGAFAARALIAATRTRTIRLGAAARRRRVQRTARLQPVGVVCACVFGRGCGAHHRRGVVAAADRQADSQPCEWSQIRPHARRDTMGCVSLQTHFVDRTRVIQLGDICMLSVSYAIGICMLNEMHELPLPDRAAR